MLPASGTEAKCESLPGAVLPHFRKAQEKRDTNGLARHRTAQ